MRKKIRQLIYSIFIITVMILGFSDFKVQAEDVKDGLTEAKNGVVEILSGFTDSTGTFRCVKTGSGFLVSNTDGDTFLLTTNHCAALTNEEKAAYCNNIKLKTDVNNTQNLIKVVVKGDMMSDASVVAQSVESDFCLLSVSNVINEKSALKLGNNEELATGATVYAMGFDDDAAAKGAEYTSVDVSVREGTIQNLESNQGGAIYLQHSAMVTAGNSGGPLLNAKGYVVGMNNSAKSRPAEGIFFSFPINEIREVLDNYDVNYYSLERENAVKDLDRLYEKSMKKYKSGNYKKASLAGLEEAIKQVDELRARPEISEDDIRTASENLETASKKLRKKMPVKEKLMIGLGILAVLLLVYFLKVFLAYRKETRPVGQEKTMDAAEEARKQEPYPRPVNTETGNSKTSQTADPGETEGSGSRSVWEDAEDDSDKTVILGMNKDTLDKTTLLHDTDEAKFLMRDEKAVLAKADGTKSAMIAQPVMSVGKSTDKADIVIAGNLAVSRVHAQIIWKEQKYYVRDLESANGTFLNNERLAPNENMELKNGDKLIFADEEYEFKVF